MATRDTLLAIVAPIVDEVGAELYDLDYNGGLLKVTVTRPDGIDLDTVGEITRRISRQLDLDDPIAGRYTLEVSSPGLERTLRLPEHWAGAIGEQVRVKLKPHVEGERRFVGTVTAAAESTALIEVDGASVQIDLDDVDRARTVFVWGGQQKSGQKKGGANNRPGGAKGSSDELDPDIRAALAGDEPADDLDDLDDEDSLELDEYDDENDVFDDDEIDDDEIEDLDDDHDLSDDSDPDNESENA